LDIQGRRRSDNFEDRGQGSGGSGGSGLAAGVFSLIVHRLGFKKALMIGAVLAVGYFLAPASVKQMLLSALTGGTASSGAPASGASKGACQVSASNDKACDFSRTVLASTEDVWDAQFAAGRLPRPARQASRYQPPTLAVFTGSVLTGGCGKASFEVGPFYCPGDSKLYIDPGFYEVMEDELKAPGDFAQAYVIAHEVGHHVQNLIGSSKLRARGDSDNQSSVRVELQADCFAGVWGHAAKASLSITDEDLREAVNAAHAIGDDKLGNGNADDYTHGTSEQRMRWFRRGFDGGDARECDTFALEKYSAL
jgi:uncharacterized protein